MHLDVGLALPQALLLVHVGRHLRPLLALLVLLVRSHCIYFRRTHPPAPAERERATVHAGKQVGFGNPLSGLKLDPPFCSGTVSRFLLLKKKVEMIC